MSTHSSGKKITEAIRGSRYQPQMGGVIPYFAGDPSYPLTLISGQAAGISNEALQSG